MPTGMHAMGKPTVEVSFTVLHAGGSLVKEAIRHLEVSHEHGDLRRQCPPSSRLEVQKLLRWSCLASKCFEDGENQLQP